MPLRLQIHPADAIEEQGPPSSPPSFESPRPKLAEFVFLADTKLPPLFFSPLFALLNSSGEATQEAPWMFRRDPHEDRWIIQNCDGLHVCAISEDERAAAFLVAWSSASVQTAWVTAEFLPLEAYLKALILDMFDQSPDDFYRDENTLFPLLNKSAILEWVVARMMTLQGRIYKNPLAISLALCKRYRDAVGEVLDSLCTEGHLVSTGGPAFDYFARPDWLQPTDSFCA